MTATRAWHCDLCGKAILPGEEFRIEAGVFSHTACNGEPYYYDCGTPSDRPTDEIEATDPAWKPERHANASANETSDISENEQLNIFTGVIV